jgi:ankyrin repeat protein
MVFFFSLFLFLQTSFHSQHSSKGSGGVRRAGGGEYDAHSACADVLLRYGVDPNICDDRGRTALHRCVLSGAIGVLEVLCMGTTARAPINLDAEDHDGYTALMHAARIGSPGAVRLLLAHGARAVAGTNKSSHGPAGNALLAAPPSALRLSRTVGLNAECTALLSMDTPRVAAVRANDVAALRDMDLRGIDLFEREPTMSTPLHEAARSRSSRDALAYLLSIEGHRAAVALADDEGHSALHIACEALNDAAVEQLLAAGAPSSARDSRGRTPLHAVCSVGVRTEVLPPAASSLGAAMSAPVSASQAVRNGNGSGGNHTARTAAATRDITSSRQGRTGRSADERSATTTPGRRRTGRGGAADATQPSAAMPSVPGFAVPRAEARAMSIVAQLLASGCDPSAKDRFALTPLHCACGALAVHRVAMLVAQGARPNRKAGDGRTPLAIARSAGGELGAAMEDVMTGEIALPPAVTVTPAGGRVALSQHLLPSRRGKRRGGTAGGGGGGGAAGGGAGADPAAAAAAAPAPAPGATPVRFAEWARTHRAGAGLLPPIGQSSVASPGPERLGGTTVGNPQTPRTPQDTPRARIAREHLLATYGGSGSKSSRRGGSRASSRVDSAR